MYKTVKSSFVTERRGKPQRAVAWHRSLGHHLGPGLCDWLPKPLTGEVPGLRGEAGRQLGSQDPGHTRALADAHTPASVRLAG